ncbi:MAG: squalene--hopene cyclase [Cyanobacteria bacterium]|nr:squalene--hopene cyclase [Cyanobacteriota bacterium]
MPTQNLQRSTDLDSLDQAIAAAQTYLLSLQTPAGYWWADLESNVTITAEIILLHKIWGTDRDRPLAKAEAYLRSHQRDHGGWELFYGDGGDLSTSVEAYTALRVLGVPASDPDLLRAKAFILSRGGISKTRIFTKFHLALIGCYDWQGLPSLPAWVMLLESPSPFTIYELSSWARGSTVPLLVVFDQKPVYEIAPAIKVDELYAEGRQNVRWELPQNGDWSDIFLWLDKGFKLAESMNLVPFREEGIRKAENWILERQEATGDWGGIIPAMLNSLLALRVLGYDVHDPVVQRGLQAVDNFAIETAETYWVQACVSPVWDTGLSLRALTDSGLAPDHPALVKAGEWLLGKQILDYGDWIVKNPQGQPGGWAFEFENRFYPDVDDTGVVAMALQDVTLPDEALKKAAIARAVRWIATMQCKDGGWAAFDINNDQDWLNAVPYGDLKAMIDPSTADITARVLEMHGRLARDPDLVKGYGGELSDRRLARGLDFLIREQEADGSWFGRWGVNYLYGTSGALSALALVAPERCRVNIERGVAWLVGCQNADGGWGETCRSYNDPALKGQGPSTASQTAWALLGLIDAADCADAAAHRAMATGVEYLLTTQNPDGTWDEVEFTGTGFPGHFYIRYHLYRQNFPMMALGRYRQLQA